MKTHQFKLLNQDCEFDFSEKIKFGENIVFGPNCKKITIGFGCFLGNDLYIDVPYLSIGDYTTIHHGTTIHGIKTTIGHNCWIGQYCIIDSLGGDTKISNNVGIGAHSQLWSHMKFGDVLEGCRWNSTGQLHLMDDVWLVGHTIIGPITAHKKSMLMTGGVMMKDMESNKIYAGNPAQILDKLGSQFHDKSLQNKKTDFLKLIYEFQKLKNADLSDNFIVVDKINFKQKHTSVTQFNLKNRTYLPNYTQIEYEFMKFLLYEKAKFIPVNN